MSVVSIANVLVWGLTAFFLVGAIVNFRCPPSIHDDYARWGYPAWFHRITGVLELLAAAFIGFSSTRWAGLALGVVVMVAALATVLWHREITRVGAPAVILALLACTAWAIY
ncbi:DoxX family protein [Pectobacterium sp. 1950-15]|uniref:DoxX family protein n=1 Tax=Pectobacterium sp. 1950-15 TaxID=3128982 RepID=UPI0030174889